MRGRYKLLGAHNQFIEQDRVLIKHDPQNKDYYLSLRFRRGDCVNFFGTHLLLFLRRSDISSLPARANMHVSKKNIHDNTGRRAEEAGGKEGGVNVSKNQAKYKHAYVHEGSRQAKTTTNIAKNP